MQKSITRLPLVRTKISDVKVYNRKRTRANFVRRLKRGLKKINKNGTGSVIYKMAVRHDKLEKVKT